MAAGRSPRARARRPAEDSFVRRSLADALCLRVDEAEARPVLVRLLEVVAEDLLELELPAALPVHALRPGRRTVRGARRGRA